MDEYYHAIRALPSWLARPLAELPIGTAERVHEVRLRVGCGVRLTLDGKPGLPPELEVLGRHPLTPLQMEEVFCTLCGGSVHTHQAEVAQGFVTLPDGCRAGLGGRFFLHPTQGVVLQELRSVNLRIARRKLVALPEELQQLLGRKFGGLLLVGEPDSGKTTLLRSAAHFLALQNKTLCVIDERRELYPETTDACGPIRADPIDCIAGLPKGMAVQMALRTLSPQVILLDELGGMDEVQALEQGMFSGVDFVATLHAASWEEAFCRPQLRTMQQHGALQAAVLLKGRSHPGQVTAVRLL